MMPDRTIVPIGTLYRHGDVLLRIVGHLPSGLRPSSTVILAHGEVTGHRHRKVEVAAAGLGLIDAKA